MAITKKTRIADCILRNFRNALTRRHRNAAKKSQGNRQLAESSTSRDKKNISHFAFRVQHSEQGMSLLAVLAAMTLFAIGLLAVAPTVHQGIQRDKELESIRRGEEVAEAIKQYVTFYGGSKLPNSMDDLLEGLPYGTKKRQILRPSAAVDPLSEDGEWRLIKFDSKSVINFGRRVQIYNNGVLPESPRFFERFTRPLVNIINTESDSDVEDADDEVEDDATDSTPFIGVASQSRSSSIIAYYGIENHSKWIFTPLFRSASASGSLGRPRERPNVNRPNQP